MKLFGALLIPVVMASDPFSSSAGDGSWQWNPVEGTQCMGGEETGAYVRYSQHGNKNLGIYLYGGGACFSAVSRSSTRYGSGLCAATTDPHPADMGSNGIFDPRTDNPLYDYNWVTVPYCSGDVHAGDATTTKFGGRIFKGLPNLKLILARAQLTFTDVETLFVTGESAGGFGSIASYVHMRDTFPDARGVLMDDSGQIVGDEYLKPCLAEEWRNTWNLNAGFPSDCPCNNDEGNLVSAWKYGMKKYPNDSFSLVSSVNDIVISTFFSQGKHNCHPLIPAGWNQMHEALEDLASSTGLNIFMIPGATHTHTSHKEFYSRQVEGIYLYQWIAQLIDASQPDPATVRPTSEDYMREEAVTGLRNNNSSTPGRLPGFVV